MKFWVFLLVFFILISLMIINNYNLHISKQEDRENFLILYSTWFGKVYSNFFKITGHFTKLDWKP